jgi:hypothetical protein
MLDSAETGIHPVSCDGKDTFTGAQRFQLAP